MPLTVQQLFQPAPSGVGPYTTSGGATIGTVPQVPGSGTWLAIMLQVAAQVQLPTTSWQSGAPERTIFAVEAVAFSLSDANISLMAQGGFLQSAASGTVTYTAVDGTTVTIPVTPDPSNPAQNPTGALGWLDLLSDNVYDVQRLAATYTSGPLAIAKLTAGSLGPYAPGTYHVASVAGPTYANLASLTIPSSIIGGTGGVITGVTVGLTSTTLTTQSAHGLVPGNSVYIVILASSGISGLNGQFALVTAATSTTFSVAVGSSGTYTGAGGNVYLCTVATMQADVVGIGSSAGPGQVTTTVTQNTNVVVSNIVPWSGSNWESNTHLVERCQDSLAARSPNGPTQAYVYFAETAAQLLAAETPAYTLTNGPVVAEAFSTPATGDVTTVVASTTPASAVLGANVTPGCAQNLITGITKASPAVVTCAGPHGLTSGMTATIAGVLGISGPNIDVNGTWTASYVSADSFSIPIDTTTASAYAGGGQVEGGDLGAIDALIQQNVVPDNTTAVTASALAHPITVTATVVVPQAYVATYQVAVALQLGTQMKSYSIGGSGSSSPANSVPWDDILGALEEAGVLTLGGSSYVRAIQSLSISDGVHTVTASGGGIPLGVFDQALLSTVSVTVLGV